MGYDVPPNRATAVWPAVMLMIGQCLAAGVANGAARVLSPPAALLSAQYSVSGADSESDAAVDERLEAARRELERAARELARLSAQSAEGPMADLIAKLKHTKNRPMLGVNIGDVDDYPASAGSVDRKGVRIVGVSPNGPADKAGIKTGDVVIALNGQPLDDGSGRSPETLVLEQMSRLEPGDPVAVRFVRDGTVNEVTVIAARFEEIHLSGLQPLLESLHESSLMKGLSLMPSTACDGLELASISPDLGAYFGTSEGVLVVHAPADSGLKLRDGDVILRIDGQLPTSSTEALRLLRDATGNSASIEVLRHGEKLLFEAVVPPQKAESRWSWHPEDK